MWETGSTLAATQPNTLPSRHDTESMSYLEHCLGVCPSEAYIVPIRTRLTAAGLSVAVGLGALPNGQTAHLSSCLWLKAAHP